MRVIAVMSSEGLVSRLQSERFGRVPPWPNEENRRPASEEDGGLQVASTSLVVDGENIEGTKRE